MRQTIAQGSGTLLVGIGMQYEFNGEATASYQRIGTASPTLKGFSGSLELGWKTAVNENGNVTLGLEGWAGKQRGVTCKVGLDLKI